MVFKTRFSKSSTFYQSNTFQYEKERYRVADYNDNESQIPSYNYYCENEITKKIKNNKNKIKRKYTN